MNRTKIMKIRTNRLRLRAHSDPSSQSTGFQASPSAESTELPISPGGAQTAPELLVLEPDAGDAIQKEGFIDLLRFDMAGFCPKLTQDEYYLGNQALELKTYCLARISSKVDASTAVVDFRILYSDAKGEKLATYMALVAALKDAFNHRNKIRVHGEASEIFLGIGMDQGERLKSDIYFALKSIELIRS
jgi:hypothetical protein